MKLNAPAHFSLDAASTFYAGFTPGSGMSALTDDGLTFAFHLDGAFEPVVAQLAQRADTIDVEHTPVPDAAALRAQLQRMLGLRADGDAWLDVGRHDRVVGELQRTYRGFFTAAKPSPYDAATWAVLAPRMGIDATAKLKQRIAQQYGHRLTLRGREHTIFPTPTRLLELDVIDGVPEVKTKRLRAIAEAALRGELDSTALQSLGKDAALKALQKLDGVGPWAASHIYFRGAAPMDGLPLAEPRVLQAHAVAYGLSSPSAETFIADAEAWRPFRMWVSVLLMRNLKKTGSWHRR